VSISEDILKAQKLMNEQPTPQFGRIVVFTDSNGELVEHKTPEYTEKL